MTQHIPRHQGDNAAHDEPGALVMHHNVGRAGVVQATGVGVDSHASARLWARVLDGHNRRPVRSETQYRLQNLLGTELWAGR